MAEIRNLKDPQTGVTIYPITKANCVYDENGVNILEGNVYQFANSEYENSINLFDTYAKSGAITDGGITYTQNSDGTITMNGTSTEERWEEIGYAFQNWTETRGSKLFPLEKGKNYTLGVVKVSGSYSGTINVMMQKTNSTNSKVARIGEPHTFNDGDGIYRMWINAKSGVSCSNLKIGIMVVEGSEFPSIYFPYVDGETIHNKNLRPILLWKNGSPTSSFTPKTINLAQSMYNFRFTYICYTALYNSTDQPYLWVKIDNIDKNITYQQYYSIWGCFSATSENYIVARGITKPTYGDGKSLSIGDCFKGNGNATKGSVDNMRCIPIAIYGGDY